MQKTDPSAEARAGDRTEAGVVSGLVQTRPDDAHNRRLVAQVRPADRRNPEPRERYDLVVVGAGTAGLVTAAGAAGVGAQVALVERSLLGGDCLNVGCVPSKALLRAARAVAAVRDADRFGVRIDGEVGVDFGAVMERMRRLRAGIARHDSVARFEAMGVDVFVGPGAFTGPETLRVGEGGDGAILRFKRACVATGSRAVAPPVEGLEEAGCLTNESVFSLTALPRRLAVIGGGPIGCELSQAFARFGAEVHLIQRSGQLLSREDEAAARAVATALARDGVQLRFRTEARRVRREGGERVLELAPTDEGEGAREEVRVDEVLVAAGRAPNVEGLGLEAAGVAFDPRGGVEVDDRLRTTNRRIYAAGDVALGLKFTHAADAAARIVVQNALFFGRKRSSRLVVPWCTYTAPEVAHVGLSRRDAEARGVAVDVHRVEMADVDRAVLDGDDDGFLEVLVAEGGDDILGATAVAPDGAALISELTLAMTEGVGLGALADVIHPYPSVAEAVKRAGDAYNRTRLTPGVKRLLRGVVALRR